MTPEAGQFTLSEIMSQPETWATSLDALRGQQGTLRKFFQDGRYDSVVFTGCGSTYYLSLAAAATMQELSGTPARGLPGSEVWLYPDNSIAKGKALLVIVSRSGETTETIRASETFRSQGRGDVLTLTCYPDKPLASIGDLNLLFPAAQEQSVAQTRAFSTLYLASIWLSALWSGREDLLAQIERVPQAGQALLAKYADLARSYGSNPNFDRFYFLGSGPRYGLANEISLKMKEMSLSHSEPFHFLEFRHGPKSMVTSGTLVYGMRSESRKAYEQAVLEDMRALGGATFTLAETDADVCFDSGLDESIRNVLYLLPGQLLAFEKSVSKGLNPDQPNNLDTVVFL